MTDPATHWYAVHTKIRAEEQAMQWILLKTTIPVFMPRVEVLRRRGRKARRIEPLFPSYFFVHTALQPDEWNGVRWSPGVKGIVSTGNTPVPVPEAAVQLLQSRCAAGAIRWDPLWKPGDEVRIKTGPFAGLAGIVDRPTSRRERVRVLLDVMRSRVPVEVDALDIEQSA